MLPSPTVTLLVAKSPMGLDLLTFCNNTVSSYTCFLHGNQILWLLPLSATQYKWLVLVHNRIGMPWENAHLSKLQSLAFCMRVKNPLKCVASLSKFSSVKGKKPHCIMWQELVAEISTVCSRSTMRKCMTRSKHCIKHWVCTSYQLTPAIS